MGQLVVSVVAVPLVTAASGHPFGLYLTGAFLNTRFDGDRLALLGETCSDYVATTLDASGDVLPEERTHPAFGATGRYSSGTIGVGLVYQFGRATSDETSAFNDRRDNRGHAQMVDHVVTMGLTAQLGPVVVGSSFGGLFRGVLAEVAVMCLDGAESFGSEFRSNGVPTAAEVVSLAARVASRGLEKASARRGAVGRSIGELALEGGAGRAQPESVTVSRSESEPEGSAVGRARQPLGRAGARPGPSPCGAGSGRGRARTRSGPAPRASRPPPAARPRGPRRCARARRRSRRPARPTRPA